MQSMGLGDKISILSNHLTFLLNLQTALKESNQEAILKDGRFSVNNVEVYPDEGTYVPMSIHFNVNQALKLSSWEKADMIIATLIDNEISECDFIILGKTVIAFSHEPRVDSRFASIIINYMDLKFYDMTTSTVLEYPHYV